ncbi:MAG: hypothetical protein ACOY3I_08555 [Verrucomicrobiota bacterium]
MLFAQNALPSARIEQSRRFDIDPTLRRGEEGVEVAPQVQGESPATPGDNDIGVQAILNRKEAPKEFTVFGHAAAYYTSNAFLIKNNPINDRFVNAEAGLSYNPKFTERFSGDVTVKQQFFRYDNNQVLDFDGQNASCGLMYLIQEFWDTAAFARYTYTRLTRANDLVDGESGTEFYKNSGVMIGLQKAYEFSKAHAAFAGVSAEFGFTDWQDDNIPNPQRDEYALFAGYQASITRSFDAQTFYRLALSDYNDQGGRQDLNQIISLGLSYKFTDWLSVHGTTSWTFNNSNRPAVGDYDALNTGGSLGVNYKF